MPAKADAIGFPLSLGDIRGFKNTLSLYRIPGEGPVRWVLDQAEPGPVDGVIFVADASPGAAASYRPCSTAGSTPAGCSKTNSSACTWPQAARVWSKTSM